ncbi:MAG: MerR family transcriptional regulator [Clostridiales bacterium]|nr:MerR family transcriptional regulator [Clostridiales bacterium]
MYEEHEYCKKPKEPSRLYRIGMFAGMNHVTVKTLRHYDEQGLLKPAYVDEESGYRYYQVSQIADLHQILALKNVGFNLEEIKEIQMGKMDRTQLIRKKQEILGELSRLTDKLAQLESYLAGESLNLSAPVLVKSLPEVTVASMQTVVKSYDALFDAMPKMGEEMERLGCVCAQPEYCFTHYLEPGYKEEQVRIETCEAVTERKEDSELIQFKVFPEVKEAACIFHKGSYNDFSKSYAVVLKYIEENGYEICGNIRESYIDGVWNKESEKEWLSEIQIPVCKIGRQ